MPQLDSDANIAFCDSCARAHVCTGRDHDLRGIFTPLRGGTAHRAVGGSLVL